MAYLITYVEEKNTHRRLAYNSVRSRIELGQPSRENIDRALAPIGFELVPLGEKQEPDKLFLAMAYFSKSKNGVGRCQDGGLVSWNARRIL